MVDMLVSQESALDGPRNLVTSPNSQRELSC